MQGPELSTMNVSPGNDSGESDFRAFLDADAGCCLTVRPDDPFFTIVFANGAYSELTGLGLAEIAGRGVAEVLTQNVIASLRQVVSTKCRHVVEEDRGRTVNSPVMVNGEIRFILIRFEPGKSLADNREVEKLLAESQARYTLAFEQAPIGMTLIAPSGAILEMNQAFLDMLGYTREQLLSRNSSAFTHPDDQAITANLFASLRDGGHNTGCIEKRYIRSNGDIIWARASCTMRRDSLGNPVQVIAIVEDITARKRAEARYRFLAESVPQMVWTATPNGTLDYVNGHGTGYLGASPAAISGSGWVDWIHPQDREASSAGWRQSLLDGKPFETSFRLKRGGDNEWRWHLVRGLPFADDKGTITQWLGTCTDIEDQKQADARLRQQWQSFDTALSNTPDLIYTYDLNCRFTYANRALLNLWGRTFEQGFAIDFSDLGYAPELAARLRSEIQQVIATKSRFRNQTPFPMRNGEVRHFDYIYTPVFDEEGNVKAIAGSTRDITEQNLAAQQIEDDRRRWRELLIQTPAGVALLTGPDHRIEWINPEYGRLVGKSREELIGKTVLQVFPEVEGQVYVELMDGVYRTGMPFRGKEAFLQLRRGQAELQDIYIDFVYLATRDIEGKIDGVFVHVNEVTDLVVARKRVEASEERFRLAFKAIEGIVYDWNPQTGDVERSGNLERLIGISTSEAAPTTEWWQEQVHPEDRLKTSLNKLSLLAPGDDHFETEFRVRHADGHWVYLCDRGYVIREGDGAIVRVVGSTHDVTEERTLLDALRQSEGRFRQAIDSMPQLVWSTLPDGHPDLYNKQWFEYTGLSPRDAHYEKWQNVHPDDRPLVNERWRHSLQNGEPFEVEFRFRRFDGQYRWFLGRATAICDNGRIVRWFGTSTDIEDRKRAELAVLNKQKLESLGLLAGGIAHDFNNLLVGVLGGASFAADELPAGHYLQPILEDVTTAAERAAHLTRQMLAYAGKGRFLVEQINLGELARSTCVLIKGSIPKHVTLSLDFASNLPAIEADSGQMQQVVMNLILNAAEAIDPGKVGLVNVRTYVANLDVNAIRAMELIAGNLTPAAYVIFEVQDNGSGMDTETQTRIFDPFFTTKFMGRGLGLSAVQGILRTQNGALELTSNMGQGSRFRVFLPTSSSSLPEEALWRDRIEPATGTILVVDDEDVVRRTTRAGLERGGFQVLLAESGERAVEVLVDPETPPLDLIILDMSMPALSGKDVMERIRMLKIDVPVLICSGYGETEVCREFAGLDFAGFIQKPFTVRQLTARIRGVLQEGTSGTAAGG